MKEKQKDFAKKLASYADVYVNDAFGTAHRAHGSTAVIADYFDEPNKMFGFLINNELKAMDKHRKRVVSAKVQLAGLARWVHATIVCYL